MGAVEYEPSAKHLVVPVYVAGMLENEFELLNMARLYMAEDVPYPAIVILQQGLEDGSIEETADNLQLLAQAMLLAKQAGQWVRFVNQEIDRVRAMRDL